MGRSSPSTVSTSRSSRSKRPKPELKSSSSSRIIGSGEMAKLIRDFDWASTPLGRVETWPDTLLTTVNMLLASRHPMFLWWGPDLIQFYNDGYRPSIRADKHPSAVGQRGRDCWPEIWHIIGPQIDAVMKRGESTWNTNQLVPINRNGKLEEVFWTYSYSPVRDKDGGVQGTLVVCSETTEQVVSERRLRALIGVTADFTDGELSPPRQSAFTRSIVSKLESAGADIPFAALYLLADGKVEHVESTVRLARLSDSRHWPLEEAAKSQTSYLVEDLQSRFRYSDLVFPPWPEPVTLAYVLPLHMPASPVQAVIVYGISPRLPFDKSYETFLHLIGTRIGGLLQSEVHKLEVAAAAKRFSRLVEVNPFGMVIGDLRGKMSYVNPAFLDALGYTEAEVNAGEVRWDKLTPPEYAEADAHAVSQLRTTGRCDVYEKAFIAKDGRRVPILIGAAAIDPAASDPEIAAFVTDLSPLKLAEQALLTANEELEGKVAERTAALEAQIQDRTRAEYILRELTGRLLLMQDEERRHMARDLHDHAGQTLVALEMNFVALIEAVKNREPKAMKLLLQSQQLSQGLSKEIRTLSYLLHPPLLDEAGLASALPWYVEGFSKRSGIQVDVELPKESSRLPEAVELVIFRIVQESLTNVHRHSGSQTAKIRLAHSGNAISVEIFDKGKGISRARLREMTAAQVGVGVRGMEERVRQFGGTLQIDSSSAGTKVSVTIPLASD